MEEGAGEITEGSVRGQEAALEACSVYWPSSLSATFTADQLEFNGHWKVC